jgi:hypothetical protein
MQDTANCFDFMECSRLIILSCSRRVVTKPHGKSIELIGGEKVVYEATKNQSSCRAVPVEPPLPALALATQRKRSDPFLRMILSD